MDANSQAGIHQAVERRKAQEEVLQNQIEAKAEELMRRDTWETFDAPEIAEASLQVANESTQILSCQDEQTTRSRQFVSIATNFASSRLAAKLRRIPELVASLKELFENMMKGIKEYGDMANELRDLIHCFT